MQKKEITASKLHNNRRSQRVTLQLPNNFQEEISLDSFDSDTDANYVVDRAVVTKKRCFFKIFGYIIFDDIFPGYVNPKLHSLLLGLLSVACGLTAVGILVGSSRSSPIMTDSDISSDSIINLTPSTSPTNANARSKILSHEDADMRVVNITETLFSSSGQVIFERDSPQNKALTWIIEKDDKNFTSSSLNLVQRYALMVMFYSLTGEEWTDNDGYSSNVNECHWYGISCVNNTVKQIFLANNNLRGKLPKEIGTFSGVEFIRLDNNGITGDIPSDIGNLQKLTTLLLHFNNISGTIPHEIEDCTNLNQLSFAANILTGSIPSSIGNLKFLEKLNFARNHLSGTIPPSFSKLSNLHLCLLFDNKLAGSILTELGSMVFLQQLDLRRNNLIGSLPLSLGNLASLQLLALGDNHLSGVIPTNFSNLQEILGFDLSNNLLSGTIPDFIGSWSNVERIDLSGNSIHGTIPSAIGKLSKLNSLGLHHNMLTGILPEEICNLSLQEVTADCANAMPHVECTCCSKCY